MCVFEVEGKKGRNVEYSLRNQSSASSPPQTAVVVWYVLRVNGQDLEATSVRVDPTISLDELKEAIKKKSPEVLKHYSRIFIYQSKSHFEQKEEVSFVVFCLLFGGVLRLLVFCGILAGS